MTAHGRSGEFTNRTGSSDRVDLSATTAPKVGSKPSRRRFLAGTAAAAGALLGRAPVIWAQAIKDITLRHYGPSYSAIINIARQAEKDLGFKIEMQVGTDDAIINRAITQPNSMDIYDLDHWSYHLVVPRGVLQGIPLAKYKWWDKTTPMFTKGTLPNGTPMSRQGTLPYSVQYLENAHATKFAAGPTDYIAMVPHITNADTLGIRPDLISRPIKHWSELLDPQFAGKTALVNIPGIGIMDAAMAFESAGEIKYGNKGDMTRAEIDKTTQLLTKLKKGGQFRAFWSTFDESVNLMASGEVVLQSMWSPAVTEVRVRGIPCFYNPLEEGYRGWASGLAIMRHVSGMKLDAAHEYLNWYLSGWMGGFIAKQGYYSSVPDTAKKFLTADEWDYWYEGKPAKGPIADPYGKVVAKPGEVRDGGAFWDRMGHIACWNTVMRENVYMVKRWNEFIAA